MTSDELLNRVSEMLTARAGLHFPTHRRRELRLGLARAARDAGEADTAAYAAGLVAGPLSRARVEELAKHLTVGESYFFRHREALTLLEQRVLPELIARRRESSRHLRLWSAGCCTGEEPYTLAILLDRLLPDQRGWKISILATDINPAFLERAEAGVYGEWSFRGVPEWLKRRYFRRLAGGRYELMPEIRERVQLRSLNLAEDSYPSPLNDTHEVDLILCRNVLMYFSADGIRAVADRFGRALAEGGWLLTGPAEASRELFPGFETVSEDGAILFRKASGAPLESDTLGTPVDSDSLSGGSTVLGEGDTGLLQGFEAGRARPRVAANARERNGSHPRQRAPLLEPRAARDAASAASAAPALALAAKPPATRQHPATPAGEAMSRSARDHADQGRLEEAHAACLEAIAADRLNPSYRYLLAVIELERGREEQALTALTQAVYLEPEAILPHLALGNLRLSQRRFREAERHLATAHRLLSALPAEAEVADSDGLTAGRLTHSVEAALERLADDAVSASDRPRA